ncbi:FabD/lysophospholipase-like protein [Aspergillus brunneoviolaceus CBS 621.78]|uniref:FabD/lysophospholipase-like protein n=1 Tax=Aspergillus brunneoviolaceus CBS 621.78 TaxID=1450534 RepID=A0ACD1GQW4_9EURO|nr:FabD/lysophospholipase-like protein [Aspergillus brunneoviolaceus CBS 621.78]RAH51517.1 FabD/lysophospholipase-like protein [Aspergillus brunneoviolaceus CBS 621.78]
MSTEESTKPLRLLSLDGGGITALSQLIILKSITLAIQQQHALPEPPRPHELFDLIGGSGHGGLLALLLGRLRLTIDKTVTEYRQLVERVFSQRKRHPGGNGQYSAREMEAAMRDLVIRYTTPSDQDSERTLLLEENENSAEGEGGAEVGCRVFVCVRSTQAMEYARLFCSYRTYRAGDDPDLTVWQAARAVTAHPGLFKPVRVGVEEFVDGSLGTKNPCRLLLDEARRLFDERRPVGCVVSLGAGRPPPVQLGRPGLFQRLLPTKIVAVVEALSLEAETVARDLEGRFEMSPDVYFRFNVGERVAGVGMTDWERLTEVESKTVEYLAAFEVENAVLRSAEALYGKEMEKGTDRVMTVFDL